MESPLTQPIEAFIGDLAQVLVSLVPDRAGLARNDTLRNDVALEAFNLTAAFIDADGVHTDAELWALVAVFAGRFDTGAWAASPNTLRTTGLLTGKRTFLDTPSSLFDLFVQADARRASMHSWRYYEAALDIARAVCALDDEPTSAELMAVERFRTMMLQTIDRAGVAHPGSPHPPAPVTGPDVGAPVTAPNVGAPATSAPARPVADAPPEQPARPIEELLRELDGLVGLNAVKAEVKLVTNLMRVEKLRRERGLPVVESSHHLVFTGNPGTGKTTVARLVAQIYRSVGAVEKGHLVETDRSGLVAGYIGQTAIRVKEVVASALGGVLLIDEAHALARGNESDFGHEAIDMLVKLMEDHRDEVVVIVAGYPAEMAEFLDANPGLRSRFPKTIFFEDYTDDQLLQIFDGMCAKGGYRPDEECRQRVLAYVAAQPRDQGFGNARFVRNLFEAAVARQASRVVDLAPLSDDQLVALVADDIPPP